MTKESLSREQVKVAPLFCCRGIMTMRIADIENGMRHVNIEGKIVNMDGYMLVVDDDSGRTFVRYSRRNLENQIEKGSHVKIHDCLVVNYSGILQLKMHPKGRITCR